MKLVRFGAPGREKPGIIDAKGSIRDLSKVVPDIAGDSALAEGPRQDPQGQHRQAAAGEGQSAPRRLRRRHVGNFIAIGLNYADHAAEAGMRDPEGADHLQQGADLHLRPERRHHDPEGLDQARLGDASSAS